MATLHPLMESLVAQRKEYGLRSATIAHRMGISEGTVRRWEAGAPMRVTQVEGYAKAVGCRVVFTLAEPKSEDRFPFGKCPDDGRCWHNCGEGACWRVFNAGPLSGVFIANRWPDSVVREHKARPMGGSV